MVYTMPILAACTLVAANLYDENENRVDEDGDNYGSESIGGDGLDG